MIRGLEKAPDKTEGVLPRRGSPGDGGLLNMKNAALPDCAEYADKWDKGEVSGKNQSSVPQASGMSVSPRTYASARWAMRSIIRESCSFSSGEKSWVRYSFHAP